MYLPASKYNSKYLGTFVSFSFSFYYGHHISTIEGGWPVQMIKISRKLWQVLDLMVG